MSELLPDEQDALGRVRRAVALGPGAFVIVGGWAARLLRLHPGARTLPFAPVVTTDIDIACRSDVREVSTRVGDQLKTEGFVPDYRSDDKPPVTRYSLSNGFWVDFIVPRVWRRSGQTATRDILGAAAQATPHAEVLLIEPCEIKLPGVGPIPVANPAAYLLQKALSYRDRTDPTKKGKDVLYLWETIALFTHAGRLHADVIDAAARIRSTLTRKQHDRLKQAIAVLGSSQEPVVQEAAKQAAKSGRLASAKQSDVIALGVSSGLAELLDRIG